MNAAPALELGGATDPGRAPDKQVNEDGWAEAATPLGRLVVVCDGMGGHAGGRAASGTAVTALLASARAAAPGTPPRDALRQAIAQANAAVWALAPAHAGLARPGSTVVALLVHADGAEIAHVGDSRAYLLHEGQVFQLTRDHSAVQRLVDAQLLTPAQAAAHPDANRILRALGSGPEVDVELRAEPVRFVAGDLFVLGTDGLTDLVGPEDLLAAAADGGDAGALATRLVALANARGGHDNVTAVVVRAREASRTPIARVAPTVVDAGSPRGPSGLQATEPDLGRATEAAPRAAVTLPLAPAIPPAPPRPPRRQRFAPVGFALGGALLLALLAALAWLVLSGR